MIGGFVLSGLLLFELRSGPDLWYMADPAPSPLYRWLASVPLDGAVIELPMGDSWNEYEWMYRQTMHHKPIVDGISGFDGPIYHQLVEQLRANDISSFVPTLEKIRCPLITVHTERIGNQADTVRSWIRDEAARGRIVALHRFEQGWNGAWVFGVRALLDDAALQRLGAGSPSDRAALMNAYLNDGPFKHNDTFGYVDKPSVNEHLKGKISIFGWALSPYGITKARAYFDNRAHEIEMRLVPYPPVSRLMPEFTNVSRPAFGAELDGPPGRRRGLHDLEIEVVDGRGTTTRLFYETFEWEP